MSSKAKSSVFSGLLKKAREEKQSWDKNKLAPISPCPNDLIDTVLANVELTKTSTLIDLGCGDGRWLCEAALHHGCHCWGVDIDPERLTLSKRRSVELNVSSLVHLVMTDFRTINLKKYSVIILYLFPEALEQIKHQLIKECSSDTIVISVGFLIKGFPMSDSFQAASGLSAYKYMNIPSNRIIATHGSDETSGFPSSIAPNSTQTS